MLNLDNIVSRKQEKISNEMEKDILLRDLSRQVKEYIINSNICNEFEEFFNNIKIDTSNNPYCKNEGFKMTIPTNKGYGYNSIDIRSPFGNELRLYVSYYRAGQQHKDFIIPLDTNKTTMVSAIKNAFRFLFSVTYEV